jgi:hypothetical protein
MKNLLFIFSILFTLTASAQDSIEVASNHHAIERIAELSQTIGIIDSIVVYAKEPSRSRDMVLRKIVMYHGCRIRTALVHRQREKYVVFYHTPLMIGAN